MKRSCQKLPPRNRRAWRSRTVCGFRAAVGIALATVVSVFARGATNETAIAGATAVVSVTSRFLLDPEAGALPRERLLDRAWATPAAGELLQRLRRDYPAEQGQIDVYVACWNYFNANREAAKKQLRELGGQSEPVQRLYVQLLARDGDWREVKKVAAATNYLAVVRAEAYAKLRNRALRAGRKDDAALYARERARLLPPESPPADALAKGASEKGND